MCEVITMCIRKPSSGAHTPANARSEADWLIRLWFIFTFQGRLPEIANDCRSTKMVTAVEVPNGHVASKIAGKLVYMLVYTSSAAFESIQKRRIGIESILFLVFINHRMVI